MSRTMITWTTVVMALAYLAPANAEGGECASQCTSDCARGEW